MNQMIAFCGLDCAGCDAYKATQANDREFMEKILAGWRVEYHSPEMTIDAVICDGCTSSGRHGGYCGECPVRACAAQKAVENCAHCPDYACDKLTSFFAMAPVAQQNLEGIRAGMAG